MTSLTEYRNSLNFPLIKTTLCYLVEKDRVLLGMKKVGFGRGRWDGIGGKVEPGEDELEAALRE